MAYRLLPIGVDNFEDLIRQNYYYVDKTWLIKEFLEKRGLVTLFTRPRRFGKTLNMSMLQCFFEDTGDEMQNQRNRELFTGLKIMGAGDEVTGQMGTFPVISLTLKSAKQASFGDAYACLREAIAAEFARHEKVVMAGLENAADRAKYQSIRDRAADRTDYLTSLAFLSGCLAQVYQKQVIIMIDEYDVPLENAYYTGFYQEMIGFIRSLFESALKTNRNLAFAVITGCLRISKESVFTGLNNLKVVSVTDDSFGEYFGFVQEEVDGMLREYDRLSARDTVKEWYDGYQFGTKAVYNPWSVVNYVSALAENPQAFPKPYWSNTSSNSIIRELVEQAGMEQRGELENLIAGAAIEKQVHEEITYEDIHESEDNLWNFLFFTGYLKKVGSRMAGENQYITMAIPNTEVKYIYRNTILTWFDRQMRTKDLSFFYQALEQGDTAAMEETLSQLLLETISFYDYAENYYHGFVAGLLRGNGKYLVKSNQESGLGRADILLRTPSVRGRAFVLEIKAAENFRSMEKECLAALEQIEKKKYRVLLEEEGFQRIDCYGICFWKKEAMVRKGD